MKKTKQNSVTLAQPSLTDFMYICDNLPEDELRQFEAMSGEAFDADEAAISCHLAPGPKWVAINEEGRPLAVGGCSQLRKGVWQTWMLVPDSTWETDARDLTKHVAALQSKMQDEGHRIQTLVLSDRVRAKAWYDTLGLECEGTLRGYGAGGEDFDMYSTVGTAKELIQRV
jgi:hypothetical protein